jgi:hypothetical protein
MSAGAYEVKDLVKPNGPLGRTKFYEEVSAGRIVLRKVGRKRLVLEEDWRAYLTSLPAVGGNNSAGA